MAEGARTEAGEDQVLSAPRFVGRDRELAALEGALGTAPALVLLEGEAGIGKTRLLREFLATRAGQGRPVLVGACPELRVPLPTSRSAASPEPCGPSFPSGPTISRPRPSRSRTRPRHATACSGRSWNSSAASTSGSW